MYPQIEKTTCLSPEKSVVCVMGSANIPDFLDLDRNETEYIIRCLADDDEFIMINSYSRIICFIREKEKVPEYQKHEELRKSSVKIQEQLKQHKQVEVQITSSDSSPESVKSVAEGLSLSRYNFTRYKSNSEKESYTLYPEKILIHDEKCDYIPALNYLTEAVYFVRDRVNEPLSHLTAEGLAKKIKEFCEEAGLKVETLTKKRIEALKMGGLIAVNRGSLDPPTFSVVEWKPDKPVNSKPVILIGKGVVFDTGGINLKPTDYIEDMKSDMAGGATVAAVLYYIARSKLPIHVMALVPATDNRPGVNAYAPGDVITMYNGKSVEVLNTDAEGRLILADALSYADNFKPGLVISVATLTGSAPVAYGSQAIATMGNADEEYFKLLSESGYNVFERVAVMPFWDEYGELLKSDIADLKNIGGKEAGAITAGKFLENFTTSPFMHLDIAGTAMLSKSDYYRPRGGTGSGVRLLSEFITKIAEGALKI